MVLVRIPEVNDLRILFVFFFGLLCGNNKESETGSVSGIRGFKSYESFEF